MKFDYMKLKGERVSKGLTQADMAKKLGISRNGYAAKERGQSDIGVDELAKICSILNIDPTEMFTIFFAKNVHKSEQHN